MNYNAEDLRQGAQIKSEAKETPSTFATNEGATQRGASSGFGKQRMAGQMMARQQQLMADPQEQQRTIDWMNRFQMSNEGMQFNQAKMVMSGMAMNAQEQQGQQ
jgi:hypothetical protein